jgi:hypothetical protein
MTVQGPRKGEPSLFSMRNGLRPQPARSVRGSSRRIMSMRFRSANIRVINRRDSYCAVIGSAVLTRNAQSSPTGMCSRYAARPRLLEVPERCSPGKGLLRRAKGGRALACSAPFRPATYATGGFHEMARRVNPFRAAPFAFFPGFLGIGSETVKAAPKARSYQP